jgi:hypothetical protein
MSTIRGPHVGAPWPKSLAAARRPGALARRDRENAGLRLTSRRRASNRAASSCPTLAARLGGSCRSGDPRVSLIHYPPSILHMHAHAQQERRKQSQNAPLQQIPHTSQSRFCTPSSFLVREHFRMHQHHRIYIYKPNVKPYLS